MNKNKQNKLIETFVNRDFLIFCIMETLIEFNYIKTLCVISCIWVILIWFSLNANT